MSYLFSYESSLVPPAVAWSKLSIWGSREKSRERSTRKETRVRLLAIRGELIPAAVLWSSCCAH